MTHLVHAGNRTPPGKVRFKDERMLSNGRITVLTIASEASDWLDSLPAPFVVERMTDGEALFGAVRALPPATVVLAECDERVPAWAWEVMTAFPSVPLVAAMDLRTAAPATVARLLDRGAADVLDTSLECFAEQAAWRFRQACARPFIRRLESGLARYASAHARTILRAAARVAVTGGAAAELAREFRVSTETVAAWCGAARLLPPRSLQSWLRVLLAAMLLQEHGRTVASIARGCGYATDRGLRRTMSRFVGSDLRSLRGPDSFDVVMRAFNHELAQARERRT
jgi:AraC-like DNA-binding protein